MILAQTLWTVDLAGCCVICGDCLECALAHSLLVQNRFVRGGIFWTVPVCKGLSASASYGCDVCAIQIRTESSQGATVFVLLAWTPAFIRKERGVLMDNIRGRSRPLAYLPIPIPMFNYEIPTFWSEKHFRFKVTNSIFIFSDLLTTGVWRNYTIYDQFDYWILSLTYFPVACDI